MLFSITNIDLISQPFFVNSYCYLFLLSEFGYFFLQMPYPQFGSCATSLRLYFHSARTLTYNHRQCLRYNLYQISR